jgi:putative endonuclease
MERFQPCTNVVTKSSRIRDDARTFRHICCATIPYMDGSLEYIDGSVDRVRARTSVLFDERERTRESSRSPDWGTYQTGLLGEEFVGDGLKRAGWRVIGHRVRTRWGELDIVARRGDMIVFGEVKTGRAGRDLSEAVTPKAQHRLRKAAVAWMSIHPDLQHGVQRYRFDVFLVHRDRSGGVSRVEHIRDAF